MVLYELESIGCPLLTLCRTLTCSFSEYKIYPGHGGMYIRKDGQVNDRLNHSFVARALFEQQVLLFERAEEETCSYQMDYFLET